MRLAWLLACGCGRIAFDPLPSDGRVGDATCTWSPWSTPRLITELQSPVDELDPALSPDGQTLVFVRVPAGATLELSALAGTTWGPPSTIPALDALGANYGAAWSADGRHLYFTSDRTGVIRLYVSQVDAGAFGPPAQVAGLGLVQETA